MSDNVPITEELRDAMKRYDNFDGTSRVVLGESNFDRLCDAIDATHANLERENSKLREQLAKARDPQRIGGTADPESFVYAIEQLREFRWQHATNDEDAIPYINNVAAAHERENAKMLERIASLIDRSFRMADKMDCLNAENEKLLEVANLISEYISHDRCEGCVIKTACDSHELDECWMTTKLRNQLRELGIEV